MIIDTTLTAVERDFSSGDLITVREGQFREHVVTCECKRIHCFLLPLPGEDEDIYCDCGKCVGSLLNNGSSLLLVAGESDEDAAYRTQVASAEPVHFHDDKWWFWDECWADRMGSYETKEKANEACGEYARLLYLDLELMRRCRPEEERNDN